MIRFFRTHVAFLFFLACVCIHLLFLVSLILGQVIDHPNGHKGVSKSNVDLDSFHRFGFLNSLFNDAAPYMFGQGADFFIILSAGKFFFEGESMYTIRIHPTVPYAYIPYPYPPTIAAFFGIVFAPFSAWQAYWIWIILNELLLGLNVFFCWLLLKRKRSQDFFFLSGMWLAFFPLYVTLYMGQLNFLAVTCGHIFLIGCLKGRHNLMIFSWVAGFLTKIVPIVFVPALLKFRQWRVLILSFSLASLLLLPFISTEKWKAQPVPDILKKCHVQSIYLPESLLTITDHLSTSHVTKPYAGSPSFYSLLTCFQLEERSLKIIKNGILLAVLLIVFVWSKDLSLASGLLLSSYLLIYQRPWEHHYVLALPLIALLAYHGNAWLRQGFIPWLFLALPTPYIYYSERTITNFLYYLPKTIGSWLLLIIFIWANCRRSHEEKETFLTAE